MSLFTPFLAPNGERQVARDGAIYRNTSVEEDEGFYDSNSGDKVPLVLGNNTTNDVGTENNNHGKSDKRKKVSFKSDVDEIPILESRVSTTLKSDHPNNNADSKDFERSHVKSPEIPQRDSKDSERFQKIP